jgi:hypothetical protein
VHLFDFHVISEYRGRGLNPILVRHILQVLADEGVERALIEAAEWNQPQLSSLARTPFRRMGLARKWRLWGRTIVSLCEETKDGRIAGRAEGHDSWARKDALSLTATTIVTPGTSPTVRADTTAVTMMTALQGEHHDYQVVMGGTRNAACRGNEENTTFGNIEGGASF